MRKPTDEEMEDYRREEAEERCERDKQRKWAKNNALHVLDPDRKWEEDE